MASTKDRNTSIAEHGHFRLPDGIDLKISTVKGGRMRAVYTESFSPGKEPVAIFEERMRVGEEMIRNTLAVYGGEVTRKGKKITITINGSRAAIGDMLTAEFMSWGNFGNLSFRDLMGLVAVAYGKSK